MLPYGFSLYFNVKPGVIKLPVWGQHQYSSYVRPFSWTIFVSCSLIIGYCVFCDFYKAQIPCSILNQFSINVITHIFDTFCIHSDYPAMSFFSYCCLLLSYLKGINSGSTNASVPLVMDVLQKKKGVKPRKY